MPTFEIPLHGRPQRFAITLSGTPYVFQLQFRNPGGAGIGGDWILDIGDGNGNPMVCGIPLVPGANLLAQYAYLGFAGGLFVDTDGMPEAVPTFTGLGTDSRLYWFTL